MSHTTTETPQTIPPDQWPAGTVAQAAAGAAGKAEIMILDKNVIPSIFYAGSPSSDVTCTVTGDPTTPENTAQPLDNTQNTVRD